MLICSNTPDETVSFRTRTQVLPYHGLHSDANGNLGSTKYCSASQSSLEINCIITDVLVDDRSLTYKARRVTLTS